MNRKSKNSYGVPRWTAWQALTLAFVLSGCEQPPATIVDLDSKGPQIRQYLTHDALDFLDEHGFLHLPSPGVMTERSVISSERASDLAVAYIRTYGPSLRRRWEREHGDLLDIQQLRVTGRIFYADSPYGTFPGGYHPAYERAFGPYYIVQLSEGSDPAVLVSVSAFSSEVKIDRRGFLQFPLMSGMEFLSQGIPVRSRMGGLASPEEAVAFSASRVGARVAHPPELVRRGHPAAPTEALWRIVFERPFTVTPRGRNAPRSTRELYVGGADGSSLFSPLEVSPNSESFPALPVSSVGFEREMVQIPVLPGRVVAFEEVVLTERSER